MISKPLKIGLSIYMFKCGTGGLQAHAEHLCRHLENRGHEVVIITRTVSRVPVYMDFLFFSEPYVERLVNGIKIRPLRFTSNWRPVQWLLSKCIHRPALQNLGIKLYEIQGRQAAFQTFEGFDIIHHVGQASALIGFAGKLAAQKQHIPFLVQPTCHPYQAGDSPLDFKLFTKADSLLVHTQYEKDYFRQQGLMMPTYVVGNGIEDRSDGNAARFRTQFGISGQIVLFVGRKDKDKGYHLIMEAFQKVRQQKADVTLVCMGPSRDMNVAQYEGVLNLDFVSEQIKHDALAACTCLCVPSEGESFGLIFMEAGRYAKPIIARKLPVLEELLQEGDAGLLLGKTDYSHNYVTLEVEELRDGILYLLSNPDECKRLGEACQKVSDNFIWSRVVRRFEESYYKAITKKKTHI